LIKIRLQRKGRIRRPIYHIVVADSRSPRDGRIIEQVGRYDGVTEKKETVLNEDRIMYWLDTGAQPTDSVRKILRQEGVLYKRHLMMWGKSEAEIEAALSEWKAYRDTKKQEEVTHRDQVKAALAAEEKEYKSQVTKKAAAAAEEMATEEATAEVEETVDEVVEAEAEEAAVEETVEEVAAEVAEEAPAEEAVTEETVEEALAEEPAAEEVAEEVPAEEPAAEEVVEETPAEEPAAEEVVEEAPAEEPATEEAKTSSDMSAKDAAEHIAATDLADLEGFVTDAEERKTVLAAWEAKKAE
jgi:small subunit ribosomal protein S16